MTVLALPESTPELFARRSTLHITSLPVVSPLMLSLYNSREKAITLERKKKKEGKKERERRVYVSRKLSQSR